MKVFLAPHNDDETLFGAFTLLRERPHVVVVFRSAKQAALPSAVTAEEREAETAVATSVLGCTYEQWPFLDTTYDRDAIENEMYRLATRHHVTDVWAPAIEVGGHDQHNLVAEIAQHVFTDRVHPYLTYTRQDGRSRWGREVPYEPDWIAAKLDALACYRSQMREPSCLPWFLTPDLREWT